MISRKSALRICTLNFPKGPEALASHLDVTVAKARLKGVEGWCIRGARTIIRVNSSSSAQRQRFTLAHELAHLVLGTAPDIVSEPFRSNSSEEREADKLASSFLIPSDKLQQFIGNELPIDARRLSRMAKSANVSPVMAACRVVSAIDELGLENAAIVFFSEGKEKWRYSQGLEFDEKEAQRLLKVALANKPELVRKNNNDGDVVVGSIIDANHYQVLLLQLLPEETASQETREERLHTLADQVFEDDYSFKQSVAGSLSIVKQKCEGKNLAAAMKLFDERYLGSSYTGLRERRLRSPAGREYLRLRLEVWFKP